MAKIKTHIAKRGNKVTVVKQHDRANKQSRSIRSSFIQSIEEGEQGYNIVIRGKSYPYPYLPDEKVGGVIRGTNGSSGKYYNRNIKGKYF